MWSNSWEQRTELWLPGLHEGEWEGLTDGWSPPVMWSNKLQSLLGHVMIIIKLKMLTNE